MNTSAKYGQPARKIHIQSYTLKPGTKQVVGVTTLGGMSNMAGYTVENISKKAALSFIAVIEGIPVLEIPRYVEQKLQAQTEFSSQAIEIALKIQFSNDNIIAKTQM